MSEIARTSSLSSVASLNQNNVVPSKVAASAVDQFDANRTSSNPRGNGASAKACNPAPATYGSKAAPVQSPVQQSPAQAAPVQCQVPAPVIYHTPQQSAVLGNSYTYQLGDIQLAPAAYQQTVQVPYHFGGHEHHIFPGNVISPSSHSVLVQPVITHEAETITIHNSHQAIDQRGEIQVAQLDCQLITTQAASPAQSPIQQTPVQQSPAYPAKASPVASAPLPATQNQNQGQAQGNAPTVP